jgi:hypothetical protein
MSFRVRDTSIAFQPVEPPVTKKKTKKHRKGKTGEKETPSKHSTPPKKTSGTTGGFQMKHDPTNQCDYF